METLDENGGVAVLDSEEIFVFLFFVGYVLVHVLELLQLPSQTDRVGLDVPECLFLVDVPQSQHVQKEVLDYFHRVFNQVVAQFPDFPNSKPPEKGLDFSG